MLEKEDYPSGITGEFPTSADFQKAASKGLEKPEKKTYERYGYPELTEKEAEAAELVGVDKDEVLLYNSGMAAVVEAIESVNLASGDVFLVSPAVYSQSREYFRENLEKRGVKIVPVTEGAGFEEKITAEHLEELVKKYRPKALFLETVGNAPGMPVIEIEKLLTLAEEINQKYQQEHSFRDQLAKTLKRKSYIKDKLYTEGVAGREDKSDVLLDSFQQTGQKIRQLRSYQPLRGLLQKLREEGIKIGPDNRAAFLELKSLFDSAWQSQKEAGFTLILDNTIPTPTGLRVGENIKSHHTPVIVAESGTKFYAEDQATLGLVYSNQREIVDKLRKQRARTGTYLPRAALERLPIFSREDFDRRNSRILANTLTLARMFFRNSRESKTLGIKRVSHPNLPGHPQYEYAKMHFPGGSTGVFYLECDDAYATADSLKAKLGPFVKLSGSFAFENIRLLPLPNGVLRVAGGAHQKEIMDKILQLFQGRSGED